MRSTAVLFAASLILALGGCCSDHPSSVSLPRGRDNGDAMAARGYDAFEQGDYETAAAQLRKALARGAPSYSRSDLMTSIGNCYNQLDQFDEAMSWHDRALEEDPQSYNAWVNKGIIHRLRSEFDEAEQCYEKALAIEPDYAEAHASLGVIYIVDDEPKKAVQTLEKAVELDPGLPIAHSNLALAYAMDGRFEDADRSLRKAVVVGYPNGEIIKARINELRALEEVE